PGSPLFPSTTLFRSSHGPFGSVAGATSRPVVTGSLLSNELDRADVDGAAHDASPLGARLDVEAATVTSRPRVRLDDVGARAVLDRPADVARQRLADRDTPTGVVTHGLHLDDGTLEAFLGVDGDACRRRLSLASQRRAQRHTSTAEREDSQGRHNQGAEEL